MKRLLILFFLAPFGLHAQADAAQEKIQALEARISLLEQDQLFIKKDNYDLYEQVQTQSYLLIFLSIVTIGSVAIMSKKKWMTKIGTEPASQAVLQGQLQKSK